MDIPNILNPNSFLHRVALPVSLHFSCGQSVNRSLENNSRAGSSTLLAGRMTMPQVCVRPVLQWLLRAKHWVIGWHGVT